MQVTRTLVLPSTVAEGFSTPTSGGSPARAGARARSGEQLNARPVLLVCGELHNLGDLALAAQNVFLATREGREVFVRTWGPPPAASASQLGHWGAGWIDGRQLAGFVARARSCDIVIGGGELVRGNTSLRALTYLLAGVIAARAGGGTVTVRGLGATRVTGARARLWRAILRHARHIAVRDERSAVALRDLLPGSHPVLATDMAFLGDRLRDLAAGADSGLAGAVVIAPCIDLSEGRRLEAATIGDIAQFARERWPSAPIVFACHDYRQSMDPAAADWLMRQGGIDGIVFDADGDLAKLQALYRDARLVVTNRLHAGIFALLHSRPLLVLDDGNPKLSILTGDFAAPAISLTQPGDIAGTIDLATSFDDAARRDVRERMAAGAARNLSVHRPAIFNVKYSPNLGDGVIAECLEGELRRTDPRLEPVSIDIAGRNGFSSGHGRHRKSLLAVLEWLPRAVRSRAIPALLAPLIRYRHAPRWRRTLESCDSAIVGGGALFADVDQNFPIKIAQALDLAAERRLPVAVASVGVSGHWSRQGLRRLVSRLRRARLVSLSVRDVDSIATWEQVLGNEGVPSARLAPDPGLLSVRQYGRVSRSPAGDRHIALCVTAPIALRLHADEDHADDQLEAWMKAVATDLAERSCKVTVFTNGSPEDRLFRDVLAARMDGTPGIAFAPDFANPGELARFLSGFDCVLAHRLHACIVAYSYGIPAVGFAWDRKLRSFFEQTGRGRYVIDPRETSPMDLADLALTAMEEGIDRATHDELLAFATSEIQALAGRLVSAGREAA